MSVGTNRTAARVGIAAVNEVNTLLANIEDEVRGIDFTDLNDVVQFLNDSEYQGFNRDLVRKMAILKLGVNACLKIAALVAMRGTSKKSIGSVKVNIADRAIEGGMVRINVPRDITLDSNNVVRMVPASQLGLLDLSPQRINACFPDLAAICLAIKGVSRKILTHDLPSFLQFPGAAGIPLPGLLSMLHKDFASSFSETIRTKGSKAEEEKYKADGKAAFNEQLYETMKNSAAFTTDQSRIKFKELFGVLADGDWPDWMLGKAEPTQENVDFMKSL